jgi:hypothetical protein
MIATAIERLALVVRLERNGWRAHFVRSEPMIQGKIEANLSQPDR